jgi:hypothetical protein
MAQFGYMLPERKEADSDKEKKGDKKTREFLANEGILKKCAGASRWQSQS